MADTTIRVDYKDCNGEDIKIIRHPNGVDTWNEIDASENVQSAGQANTADNVTRNEIEWWKQYAGQDLTVADVFIGFDISVDDYITELESYL
jgi:hypothetical protein